MFNTDLITILNLYIKMTNENLNKVYQEVKETVQRIKATENKVLYGDSE